MASIKCRKCGNVLHFNPDATKVICNKCGSGYVLQKKSNSASNKTQINRRSLSSKSYNNRPIKLFILLLIALITIGIVIIVSRSADAGKTGGNKQDPSKVTDIEQSTKDVTTKDQSDDTTDDTTKESADDTTVSTPPISQQPTEVIPTFNADLSEYEKYMNPTGKDRDAYLILVNPDNPLTANDVPTDLVSVKSTRKDGRATQKLREYAAKALEALMLEAEAQGVIKTNTPSGYPLSVMSAYRTYEYQNQLFNTYVNQEMSSKGISREKAEAIVVTYSCRAGTSEHQTALCVDMHTLWSAGVAFKNEAEAKWLAENSYKFGFILRFPEDKTDITKITYEPWHFRYVGRYHATKMHDLDMCLEEYTEYLKKNG